MRNLWLPTAFTFPHRNEKTDLTGLFLGALGNWKARRHEINRAGDERLANTLKQACRTIDDNLAGTLKGDRQSARLLIVAVFATFMHFHSVQRHCSYFLAIHFDRPRRSEISKLNLQAVPFHLRRDRPHCAPGIVLKLALGLAGGKEFKTELGTPVSFPIVVQLHNIASRNDRPLANVEWYGPQRCN